mgnify:CR=1 FL=1
MADLTNRSRFSVRVKNRADLCRCFPFSKTSAVKAYLTELRRQGYKPSVEQLDESGLVRAREIGQRPTFATFKSRDAAVAFLEEMSAARQRGVLKSWVAARQVTVADLIVRYLLEEAPRHKSRRILAYSLENWLADSGTQGEAALDRYRQASLQAGREVPPRRFQVRKASDELAWLHKPLADVATVDVERYITDRLTVVAPATVDREIDRLKSLFQVATRVWDYQLARNPMDGVRRPKYFNERERRISKEEERRLLMELTRLDQQRSFAAALDAAVDTELKGIEFSSTSARKRARAAARKTLAAAVRATAHTTPHLQAFYQLQVLTAARRSETLGLDWDRVDLQAGTAYLPETKNGRPRKLALRASLVRLLSALPRLSDRVIPLGLDYVVGAWNQACSAAGIEDLHIHDLRHEALSRLAETGEFSLPELQLFSGHRDLRMLMRYSHLCASRLAKKIDSTLGEAEGNEVSSPGAADRRAPPNATVSNVLPFARVARRARQ